MPRHYSPFILCLFAFLSVLTNNAVAADQSVEGSLDSFLGEPSFDMQQVFKDERFPNVVVTLEGTVLVTWGNNVIRARRSEDGGKTWVSESAFSAHLSHVP